MVNVYYVSFTCEVEGQIVQTAHRVIAADLQAATLGLAQRYGEITVVMWSFAVVDYLILP